MVNFLLKWIKKRKYHIAFWTILIIYILIANPLYIRYFMIYGKPEASVPSLSTASSGIIYQFGNLGTIRIAGQNLYELRGFALNQTDPLMKNKISIVLQSPAQRLLFATHPITIPGMIKSYRGYQPGMDQAEFSLFLSLSALKPGVYQIGILLENQSGPITKSGSGRTFGMTGSSFKITPNTITYQP